jgi:hypothetical protein
MARDDDRRCLAAVRDDLAALQFDLGGDAAVGLRAIIEAIDQHFSATGTPTDPRRN